MVGLAERDIDDPVGVAIYGAAQSKLFGIQDHSLSGASWGPEASANRVDINGVGINGVSRTIVPGGRLRTEKYGVSSFLSFEGVTVHSYMDEDLITVDDGQSLIEPSQVITRILTAVDGDYAGAISLCQSTSH